MDFKFQGSYPSIRSLDFSNNANITSFGLLALAFLFILLKSPRLTKLSHFPGPWHTRFSGFWRTRSIVTNSNFADYVGACRQYGQIVRIAPNHLLTSSPDLVLHMSNVRSAFQRNSDFYLLARLMPGKDNIASITGKELHSKRRATNQPAYGIAAANEHQDAVINPHLKVFLEDLRRFCKTSPCLDLAKDVRVFATKVGVELIIGTKMSHLTTTTAAEGLVQEIENDFNPGNLIYGTGLSQWLAAIPFSDRIFAPSTADTTMNAFFRVSKKIQEKQVLADTKELGLLGDLLRRGLTPEQAVHDAMVAVLAGEQTVGPTIGATLQLLAAYPHVCRTLEQEISGAQCDGRILKTELVSASVATNQMPYAQAVVRESLRFWPPALDHLPKIAPTEGATFDLSGKTIFVPGGTRISVSLWDLLRRTDVYGEDAASFRPERWLEADEQKLARMRKVSDLLFGFGAHVCPGINMTKVLVSKTIVELVRNFHIEPAHPIRMPDRVNFYGVWKRIGCFVKIKHRESDI